MAATMTDSTGRRWRQPEVDALLDVAARVWRQAPGHARAVRFRWHGRWWLVGHSSFRLVVHDRRGRPIATRYD